MTQTLLIGTLVKMKADAAKRYNPPNPRPVLVVTRCDGVKFFEGTAITGRRVGATFHHKIEEYEPIHDHVTVKVRQPSKEFRVGDLVTDQYGVHVVVSSVKQAPYNGLFSGMVYEETSAYYRGQYSDHWKADRFKLVRRREDMQDEKVRDMHAEGDRIERQRTVRAKAAAHVRQNF